MRFEAFLECGVHVHLVWVDDLGLFFQVKCLFVATSMGVFGGEFFLVVADRTFGVRVADEVVHAPALPSDMCITCWQLLKRVHSFVSLRVLFRLARFLSRRAYERCY